MASLMLVNPRKRGGTRRKARTAAQKAATRRMLAARHGKVTHKRKRRASSARRSNPIGLSRVHHAVRRHRRRHNPIGVAPHGVMGLLVDSLKGATGAVAVNAVTSFLPGMVKSGKMLYVTRFVVALGLGTLGRKVLGNNARKMAEGAMVVNTYDLVNNLLGSMLPGSQLHGVGAYMDGVGDVGAFLSAADTQSPYMDVPADQYQYAV